MFNQVEERSLHQKLLYLKLAFHAREPPSVILLLARESGGGSITSDIQQFILAACTDCSFKISCWQSYLYIKTVLKKVIVDVESSSNVVLDELYEKFGDYMNLNVDEGQSYVDHKIFKEISFLSPSYGNVYKESITFVARVQCSTDMLEGDTGCSLWPSSLFLAEFIFSNPNIFFNKSCFEVGSGVGLVGLALKCIGASKVVLTDGDFLTLENLKTNMNVNGFDAEAVLSTNISTVKNRVECRHLSWENALEDDILEDRPDVILGADVVYDPRSIPHLVRLLSTLLKPQQRRAPTGYIATVIRNAATFDLFKSSALGEGLCVVDVTGAAAAAPSMLPYMLSYDRSSVRLFKVHVFQ